MRFSFIPWLYCWMLVGTTVWAENHEVSVGGSRVLAGLQTRAGAPGSALRWGALLLNGWWDGKEARESWSCELEAVILWQCDRKGYSSENMGACQKQELLCECSPRVCCPPACSPEGTTVPVPCARILIKLVLLPQSLHDKSWPCFCWVLAAFFSPQETPEHSLLTCLPEHLLLSLLLYLCLSFRYICVFALQEGALFPVGSPRIGVERCTASHLCLALVSFLLMRPMLLWQKR